MQELKGVFYIADNQSGLISDADLKGNIQDDRLIYSVLPFIAPPSVLRCVPASRQQLS